MSSQMQMQNGNGVFSLETRLARFQRSIALSLFLWPTLTLAVTSNWGGPDSSQKREWFCGTLIDLLCDSENSDVDAEWIEELLLQVMQDEFEVVVEDGSAEDVAKAIVKLRGECGRGDFGGLERLEERWEVVKAKNGGVGSLGVFEKGEEQGDTSGSEDEDEDEDGDVAMDMGDAPEQTQRTKEKIVPEVDEDGFTTVIKRRR